MRIPSQFNEDSLYRRGSRPGDSVNTSRKLIRLMIGLVLIVMVMRQAAQPAVYQTFFGETPTGGAIVAQHVAGDAAVGTTKPLLVDPEDRVVARIVSEELLPSDQRQWIVALSRWQTGRSVEMVPSTIDSVRATLREDARIDSDRQANWLAMLDSFQEVAGSGQVTAVGDDHAVPLAAWLAALDQAAAERVFDGSTWRSGDFGAFYRYLDQAATMSDEGVANTGVIPLLQQPDVYRNQLVRVAGGVARAERIEAQENPFGVTEYWQLWLRPSDGADRPLLAIVPDVPSLVAAVGPNSTETEGPQVTLVGRYLKRLSYSSAMGADLAPVVVGRLLIVPMTEAELADTAEVLPAAPEASRLWITVLLASLFGIAIAGITMWRTGVAAKRAREIRNAHREQPDLKGLGEQLPQEGR